MAFKPARFPCAADGYRRRRRLRVSRHSRRRRPALCTPAACGRRSTAPSDRQARRLKRSPPSRGSLLTVAGRDPHRVQGQPRWQALVWSWCRARSRLGAAAGSRRPGTGPPRAGDRSRGVRTTRPRPGLEGGSRGRGRRPERRQIAPLIGFVQWVPVIGGVGSVNLH